MDAERLAERSIGRKEAKECIELIEGTAGQLSPQSTEAFWDSIREFMAAIVPKEPEPESAAMTAMNDTQAFYFGSEQMPFGKYRRALIADVPLVYLDWLIDAPDEFKDQLRAYLKNEEIANRLAEELGR